MRTKTALAGIIFVDLLFLLYGVHTLSISYKEAEIFFEGQGFLHYLVQLSTHFFGQNDYALRAPFIVLHLLSILLMYQISKFYLKRGEDRLLSVVVFVLLPGIVSSALLVNASSVVIFFTLLFLYLFLRRQVYAYMLLLPLLLLESSLAQRSMYSIFSGSILRRRSATASCDCKSYISSYI